MSHSKVKAIEQSNKMAGRSLDPDARSFVPNNAVGSRNSRTPPYPYDQRSDEPQYRYSDRYSYTANHVSNRWNERYYDSRYPREPYEMHEPTQTSFPSSQELRDFYQELQNGAYENRDHLDPTKKSRTPPQRHSPPKQLTAQHSPVAPEHQAGSRITPHHHAERNSPPRRSSPPLRRTPPQQRRRSPPQQQRRSPPKQQRRSPPKQQRRSPPKQQRMSPSSFANVARTSLERRSTHSTPSPTTENGSQNQGLNAPGSRERQRPISAERKSPPKKDDSYDADAEVNLIRSQLEFYFSDKNLLEESNSNLIFYMLQGKMWVPLHVVCALPKIRDLGGKRDDVLNALRTSSLLELNGAENKVRRPGYQLPPDFKVRKSLRRSVLVYGLPQQMTDAGVRNLLEIHGNILCVAFPNQNDAPDIETGRIIMKKKLGDPANLMKLTCAFVVFESQSQANKCVKARSRSSSDGIRTMHKYDYNKVVKRLGKGMDPNSSPLWTPTASPSFNSEPRSNSLGATPTFNSVPGGLKLSPAHNSHGSPHFGSRSMSRSPALRSMNSRSPFYRSHGSPGMRSQRSPSWKLEENGDISSLRQRSSSMNNRRVILAKGPDNTKGFRWPRNPQWKSTRTTLDVLNTTMV